MDRMTQRLDLFIAIGLVLTMSLLQGCSGLSLVAMVPETIPAAPSVINKTVQVVAVKGGEGNEIGLGTEFLVTSDKFNDALNMALSKSGYFRAVRIGGEADIDLFVEIVSASPVTFNGYRYRLVVEYKFNEHRSGKLLWRDTIQSEYESSVFASGISRVRSIREGSVRENLIYLLNWISTQWPQNAK